MFDFLKKKRSAPKELSDEDRQREWDRKIERETYNARAEERELEKKMPVVYYEKSCEKKGKKSWSEMTHEERRKQVRERDAQLIKEYKETKMKLKSVAKKGGSALKHVASDAGNAVKTSRPFLKQLVKDVGHAGKVAADGIERMSDNYERHQREDDRKRARARKEATARRARTARKTLTTKAAKAPKITQYKTFNEKRYELTETFRGKYGAEEHVEGLKRHGLVARIVKVARPDNDPIYVVYARKVVKKAVKTTKRKVVVQRRAPTRRYYEPYDYYAPRPRYADPYEYEDRPIRKRRAKKKAVKKVPRRYYDY